MNFFSSLNCDTKMWLQYNYTLNPIGIFNAIKYMYTYYPDPNNRSHIREEFVNFWSDYFFVAPQVSIQGLTQPLSHQGGLCQLLVRLLLRGTSGQYRDSLNLSHIREEFVNFWSDYFFLAPPVSL